MKRMLLLLLMLACLGVLVGCKQYTLDEEVGGMLPSTPSGPVPSEVEEPAKEPSDTPVQPNDNPTPVEGTQEPVTLPAMEQVKQEDAPVMWEFLHDCLGYYSGMRVPFMVAMVHDSAPTTLYAARYRTEPVQYAPKMGSSIYTLSITEDFSKKLLKDAEIYLATEGGWHLLDVSSLGQQLSEVSFMYDELWEDEGYVPYLLRSGHGYDTETLRNGGYADALLYEFGLDIYDHWWDSWRYQARYNLVRTEDSLYLGYVMTDSPGSFSVYSDEYTSTDGGALRLSNNELWMTLLSEGLELKDAPTIEYMEEDSNEF